MYCTLQYRNAPLNAERHERCSSDAEVCEHK